jgi:hypothetical protein
MESQEWAAFLFPAKHLAHFARRFGEVSQVEYKVVAGIGSQRIAREFRYRGHMLAKFVLGQRTSERRATRRDVCHVFLVIRCDGIEPM